MHGVVLLGESLFCPVQALIDGSDRAAEHFGDFTVRNTFPRGETEDFSVTGTEPGCRLEYSLILGALNHDGFRTREVANPDHGCSGDQLAEPTCTPPPPRYHTLGDDEEPRASRIAAGHICDSRPSDLKDLIGCVIAISGRAAAHTVGENISEMLPV